MHACAVPGQRVLAAALLLATACTVPAAERELAAPPEDFVEVEVTTVGLSTSGNAPVVLLREPGGSEMIPIFVGPGQARAILLALRGADMPRPMTHDLLGEVIGALDARLARVYVDAIVEGTFFGMLELEVATRDAPLRIDARPSDAIAVALRTGASIHVAPQVLEEARLIGYQGLREDQQVVTAVGITVMAPTAELREALSLPDRAGLVVSNAVGPARGAGLEAGALVLTVNGETPASPMEFLELVRATPERQRVHIRYWLDGGEEEIELPTRVPDRPGARLATPGPPRCQLAPGRRGGSARTAKVPAAACEGASTSLTTEDGR
ncbi:MAG: bifunctional nuclease domain-containing protein [Halofilum sp. (in: g-proteobacteria)]|nr:bifunctional nuclease domain-containing protein [Halofilum sp. (in: g-proteobacteria)]